MAERLWNIAESTPVGHKISQVRGTDADNDSLSFSMGGPSLLPGLRFSDGSRFFAIDRRTGAVSLKQSLLGMRSQRLMVSVGVNDGVYNAKMDIVVQVTAADSSALVPSSASLQLPPRPIQSRADGPNFSQFMSRNRLHPH